MKSPSDFGSSLATLNDILNGLTLQMRAAQTIATLLLEHAADDLEKPKRIGRPPKVVEVAAGEQRYDTLGRRIPVNAGRPPIYARTPGVCPKCHKQFKNLKLHVNLKHTHKGRMSIRQRLSKARDQKAKLAA
jgi:hypothetical protein